MTHHALSELDNLARKRNQLLAAMSVLAEGPTAKWDQDKGKKAKQSSRAPRDFDSLYDRWRTMFDEDWPDVPDDPDDAAVEWCTDRAYRLVTQAEAELKLRRGDFISETLETVDERDKRIVKQYEGMEPGAVAAFERCPVASVKALRRMVGRDATTGRRS